MNMPASVYAGTIESVEPSSFSHRGTSWSLMSWSLGIGFRDHLLVLAFASWGLPHRHLGCGELRRPALVLVVGAIAVGAGDLRWVETWERVAALAGLQLVKVSQVRWDRPCREVAT